jgi:hypothetical protein
MSCGGGKALTRMAEHAIKLLIASCSSVESRGIWWGGRLPEGAVGGMRAAPATVAALGRAVVAAVGGYPGSRGGEGGLAGAGGDGCGGAGVSG